MNSIKEHYLYPMYLQYLEKKRMSKGALELSKICEEAFFEFKYMYDSDDKFRNNQEQIYKSIVREDKINAILDDEPNRNLKSGRPA
jgi:hypothetical protein